MSKRAVIVLALALSSLLLLCACAVGLLLWRQSRPAGPRAVLRIDAGTRTLQVGDQLSVEVVLLNSGSMDLGLPQYRLSVDPEQERLIVEPQRPEPVVHYLGVIPGQSDVADFLLEAVRPGEVVLCASVSFEVHLDYPGPAYWDAVSAAPVRIVVLP